MGIISEDCATTSAKEYLKKEIKSAVDHLEGAIHSCFQRFWHDTNGVTPQQILDAFGTDAATLVRSFSSSKYLVNLISPGKITTEPPKEITLNEDGTATVVND